MTDLELAKMQSELDYLRRLKSQNSKTITKYAEKIRRLDILLAEQDAALNRIMPLIQEVLNKINTVIDDLEKVEAR